MIERRWLWMRGPAWLITELLRGGDIIARFQPYLDGCPPEQELVALDRLFAALIRERISHGDLKGHNLFWEHDRWSLIDLDAVQQHGSDASFARAYARTVRDSCATGRPTAPCTGCLTNVYPVPGTSIED